MVLPFVTTVHLLGYYLKFLSETDNEWGKENHVLSITRFNIIAEPEYSDLDRAIELTKNNRQRASLLGEPTSLSIVEI